MSLRDAAGPPLMDGQLASGTPTAQNLADLYDLPPIAWGDVRARLEQGFAQAPGAGGPDRHTCWLTTLNADGSPHTTGVGALYHQGTFWFETGLRTRKGANLARDPRCTVALALRDVDVVVEGRAELVTDPAVVADMAALWSGDGDGWPARVDESGQALTAEFSAPSAGPPPWYVYRLDPGSAHAVLNAAPGGATRWRF